MSQTDWCSECHTYHFGRNHLPEFRAGIPEMDPCDPRDYPTIRARNAEDAAEKFAERWDNGDYGILNGSEVTVVVLDEMGYLTKWKVSGETVAVYHAKKTDDT